MERLVQELKKFLIKLPQCDPVTAVSKFLFMYRNTPHVATQVTPASSVQVPTQEAILPPSLPSSQCSIPVSGTAVSQDLQLPDEVLSLPAMPQVQIPELRRSGRTIKAPDRLDLYDVIQV